MSFWIAALAMAAAAVRAMESCRPEGERLIVDRFAQGFLSPRFWAIVQFLRVPGLGTGVLAMRERQYPGVVAHIICRTRFIDDALCQALAEGLDQVVILGAGFDSRAYRTAGVERVRVS